jgi:hypothetical protein
MNKEASSIMDIVKSMKWMVVPLCPVALPMIGSKFAQAFMPKSEDFFIVLFFIFGVLIFIGDLVYAEYKNKNLEQSELSSEVGSLPISFDSDSGHCSDGGCH